MRDTVFRPSFGNKPSVLVGRDDVVSTFRESLDSPAGVIEQERRGVIVFMLPRMKEYLRRKYAEE